MKKGQITVEFIITTALVSLIFLVVITMVSHEQKSSAQSIWSIDGQNGADMLAQAIDSVYVSGAGSVMNVTLPKKLAGGIAYNVTVRQRLVSLAVPAYGRDFERKFLTAKVQGADTGLALAPGTVTITNINGTINMTSY